MIAIAVSLPMVSDMSGRSGNQAVGISMRELSLELTRPIDLFHVLRKELSVGYYQWHSTRHPYRHRCMGLEGQ